MRAAAANRRATSLWVVLALAVFAMAALAAWDASPYARYLDHAYLPDSTGGRASALMLYPLAWVLMILAMMLPTAGALLTAVGRLGRDPAASRRLQLWAGTGFVAMWAAVGVAFRAADSLVHAAVGSAGWLAARPHLLGAATLVLAGAFQFSTMKHRCLTACRSSTSFVYRHWHGEHPGREAVRIGASYGLSCIGCCWALMLVMFGLGTANLALMLGLGAVMSAEKNTAVGLGIGRAAGIALLVAGAWVALGR